MAEIDFGGYQRRLDVWDYRGRRRDVPHDVAELLELAREIEATDRFMVDVTDKDE